MILRADCTPKPIDTPHNMPSNMPNSNLEAENLALRGLLQTLTADATHNQAVMQRFQARELALLNAQNLPDLLERLTTGLHTSFALETVRLVLLDPYGVLRELLAALGAPDKQLPQLTLAGDYHETTRPYPDLNRPWLGPWQQERDCRLFPGATRVKSVALVPLRQPGGLSGFLNLGSNDPNRFRQEQGTEFLARLAQIAAVCLENAVNRERLRLTGLTDGLTGLYNRRHLETRLDEETRRACRHGQPFSCLFIDADRFKQVNDHHGHSAGDQVLIALAQRVREQLRGSDLATRYGGEEIAVLLPQTDVANAHLLAERIRRHIADTPIALPNGRAIGVTVSIGVAQLEADCSLPHEKLAQRMLDTADRQVYRAKEAGRNCVRCAS